MKTILAAITVLTLSIPAFTAAQTSCPSLSLGSTGVSVTAVQKILYAAYANFPTPTGYFGPTTQAALKQWQKDHGIEQTGGVGPKTSAAMKLCTGTSLSTPPTSSPVSTVPSRTLSKGMSGSDVLALQQFLVTQKLLALDSATGYFGALTEAAVKKFQSQKGIASSGTPSTTGYGAVGPRTREILNTRTASPPVPTLSSTPRPAPSPVPLGAAPPTPPPPPTSATSCNLNGTTVADGSSKNFYNDAGVAFSESCESHALSRVCTNGVLSGSASYQYSSCAVGAASACSFNASTVAHGASVAAYHSASVAFGSSCAAETRTCGNGTLSGSYQNASCSVSAPTPPNATISADSTSIRLGQSTTIRAAFTAGTGDRLTGTAIDVPLYHTVSGIEALSNRTYDFMPSTTGDFTFYTRIMTTNFTWETYPSVSVHVSPPAADQVSAQITGPIETIFRYSTDACNARDLADAPARAFHDGHGGVQLFASNGGPDTYRLVGTTLDNVRRDCTPVMHYGNNPDFDVLQDAEWIFAPYTLDGSTIMSLVHNEWHEPETVNPSCENQGAWVNAITEVVSRDNGNSWGHQGNDYKIRIPAPWQHSFSCTRTNPTVYGSFEPSNIVAKDGYYYSIYSEKKDPVTAPGPADVSNCIMRTQDLWNASSWQVWSGSAWESALSSYYCGEISQATLNPNGRPIATIKSITYNTYLHSYVGIVAGDFAAGHGFGYTVSQDLMNWSAPAPLLLLPSPQGDAAYPSLLDPSDTSRNFEMAGQDPYLYYSLFTSSGTNLVRQRVHFSIATASAKNPFVNLANALTALEQALLKLAEMFK